VRFVMTLPADAAAASEAPAPASPPVDGEPSLAELLADRAGRRRG
jgi:hypothetical protein